MVASVPPDRLLPHDGKFAFGQRLRRIVDERGRGRQWRPLHSCRAPIEAS